MIRGLISFLVLLSTCMLSMWAVASGPTDEDADPVIEKLKALREMRMAEERERQEDELRQLDALKAALKSAQALRDQAAKDFDPPGLGDAKFESRDQRVAKVAEFRRTTIDRLMNLPFEQNILRIHNGSALNALNGCIGRAALQHEIFLRKIEGQSEPTLSELDRSTKQLIEKIAEDTYISAEYIKEIDCKTSDGTIVRLNLGLDQKIEYATLPLAWPIWFKLNSEPKLAQLQKRVETARDALLKETDDTKRDELRLELIKSVELLTKQFQVAHDRYAGDWSRGDESKAMGMRSLMEAKRYVTRLRQNVLEVVRVEKFPDSATHFKFNEYLREKNGEVSIITLLAVMEERGLSFADARGKPETQRASEEIFKSMRSYFYGLYAIEQTVRSAEQDVEQSLRRIEHLEEVERMNLQFDLASLALAAMAEASKEE